MRQTARQLMMLALSIGLGGSLEAQPGGNRPPKGGGNTMIAAPTGVSVSSDATALTVSWGNVANAGGYEVNRREGGTVVVTLASGVPGTPYSGPLPMQGTAYEYQVVAFGGKNKAASQWVAYTVPLSTPSTTSGVPVTEPRPGRPGARPTPTIIPAGPTSLTAASSIPGEIVLVWKAVTNATAYRITRTSNAPEVEQTLAEKGVAQFWSEGGLVNFTHAPADERWVHTYKVFALFGGTLSTPSPAATASSAPFVQPTGLKYSAVPSVARPGTLNVTVSWNAVPNAARYTITGTGFTGQASMTTTSTSVMFPNLAPRTTFTGVCLSTVYPFLTMTQGAPCIDIKL